MSTTSIKYGRFRPLPRRSQRIASDGSKESIARPALTWWQRLALETLGIVAVIAVAQRNLFGDAEFPGLPNLYWLPVLLASCQYGVAGLIATVVTSAVYLFGLSPQSAAQDFYAYATNRRDRNPRAWLATALVFGGLRSLHLHQYSEMADHLAVYRRRANDLSEGLEQATAEINAWNVASLSTWAASRRCREASPKSI